MIPAPSEIFQVTRMVAAALDAAGARYFVGGSVASALYGEARSTRDIDLVAAMLSHHVAPFLAALVALLVRAVMKLRARDSLLESLGTPYFRGGLRRELRWLQQRVERRRLQDIGAQLVGEPAALLLPDLAAHAQPSVRQLRMFGRRVRPSLDEYRLFATNDAVRQMATRELGVVWWKVRNWYQGAPTKSTRTLPHGGVSAVHRACGLSRNAIARGIEEIKKGGGLEPGRIRRRGGGRKPCSSPTCRS